MSDEKKIVHLSDAELTSLRFLGDAAVQQVIDFIEAIRKVPTQYDWITVFQLQCLNAHLKFHPATPASPTLSASSGSTASPNIFEITTAEHGLVSPFERVHFYTGVSEDPPPLLHRSDLLQRPFVIPLERHSFIPEKTAHGVHHPVLKNKFWKETVAPEIIALLKQKSRGIRVSTMLPVHFSTADEDGKDVFDDHIVLWISVHPDTTKEISCRDANDEILAILAKHGIQDAAVHWFEGAIKSFCGFPPMMRVARDTDPTHWIRRALTAHLSVPIVAEAFTKFETPGTLGLFFREGKDRSGNESTRVMALTNKHLTSYDIKQDYEYSGRTGAPKQFIRNCGSRRFQQIVNEARALIANKLEDVKFFAEELAQMSAKLKLEDQALTVDEEEDLRRKREDLQRAKKDIVQLEEFLRLLNSTWSDDYQRIIGFLDWAPRVANDLDHRCYTRDLAVIALDEDKFKDNFRGNSIYLAGKYTRKQITSFFNAANPPVFQYPNDHLFRLSGCVDATGLANPCSMDEDNKACFIVAKDGQSTDLTFGRFSELEAYTCKDFVHDSWEVAVFNYNKKQGNFSGPGDSGAAIFNARGALMAILHSGMPRGAHSHVTFGTPGHYVVELIKERYPYADFECLQFDA